MDCGAMKLRSSTLGLKLTPILVSREYKYCILVYHINNYNILIRCTTKCYTF